MLTGAAVSEKTTNRRGESSACAGVLPTLRDIERRVIEYRMQLFNGNKTAVARSMGISLKTLYNRLAEYRAADGRGGKS